MSNPWQAHDEAKQATARDIGDLTEMLHAVRERAQEVAGYVANATGGENCPNEFGRSSFELISNVPDKIDEAIAACQESIDQLGRYIF